MKKFVFDCFHLCIPALAEDSANTAIPDNRSAGDSVPLRNFEALGEEFPLLGQNLLAEYDNEDEYTRLEKIGEGSFSKVYKGISKNTSKEVALKKIKLFNKQKIPGSTITEISILKKLMHTNIVSMVDVITTSHSLTIVLEYIQEDLRKYLRRKSSIHITNVKIFLFQILRGLAYCHEKKIIHRDIKPSNILVNERGELKLADFNLARHTVPLPRFSPHRGTLKYKAPEILVGTTNYTEYSDIWSVGCIFYEMASGKTLFPGISIEEMIELLQELLGPMDSPHNQLALINSFHDRAPRLQIEGLCLLTSFINYNQNIQRISASAAMKMDYFDSLGPEIHKLPNDFSVYTIQSVQLCQDPDISDV